MAETELSEVARLEAEIEKEVAVKEHLEAGLKADKAALEQYEKKRKAVAYKALAGNNPRAAKQLNESETQLTKLALRINSREQAIQTSNENIAKLREQRAEAAHAEGLRKYNEQLDELLVKGAKFDVQLSDFLRGKTELEAHLETLDKLSFAVFSHDSRPHRIILRALHWALETRLKIPGPFRDREFKQNHSVPIQDIFTRILRHGEPVTEQPQSKPDGEKPAVDDSGENGARKKASK